MPARRLATSEAWLHHDGPVVRALLKQRAVPLAVAFGATAVAGVMTDVVSLVRILALGGGESLLIMFPLSTLGVALPALLLTPLADRWPRLPMLRRVGLAMSAAYAVSLGLGLSSSPGWAVAGAGLAWIVASLQNYLYPMLMWSLAGDVFNVAESKAINGWIVSWSYVGRLVALVLTTATPALYAAFGLPLAWLYGFTLFLTLAIALWLPHVMRNCGASDGITGGEGVRESLASGWRFIHEVRVWRWLVNATLLSVTAAAAVVLGSSSAANLIVGSTAGRLQVFLGGVQLLAAIGALAIRRWWAPGVMARIGIRGAMLIYPIVVVGSALLLTAGVVTTNAALVGSSLLCLRLAEWTFDQNARSAALGFVPDQRRARVGLLLVLAIACGWAASALVAAPGLLTDAHWLLGTAPAAVGLLALAWWARVYREWDASMLDWHLRRRKRRGFGDL